MKYLLYFLSCAALSAQPLTNLQFVRVGAPDGGGGNTFYEAFIKVNNNFLQLSNQARVDQTNFTGSTNYTIASFNAYTATNETIYNPSMTWNYISNSIAQNRTNWTHTFMPGPYNIFAQHLWTGSADAAPFMLKDVKNITVRGQPFAEFRVIGSMNPTGQLFTAGVQEPSYCGVVMEIKDYDNVKLENFRLIAWNTNINGAKTNIHGATETTVPAWITVAGTNSQNFVMENVELHGFPNQGIYHSVQVQGSSTGNWNTRQTNNFIYRCRFKNGGSTNVGGFGVSGLDGTAISSIDNTVIDSCVFENNFRDLEPYRDPLAYGGPFYFTTRWWVNKCQFYNTLPGGYVFFQLAPRCELWFTDNLIKVDRDPAVDVLNQCNWASISLNLGGIFNITGNKIIGFRTLLISGANNATNGTFYMNFSGNQCISNRVPVYKTGTGGAIIISDNQFLSTQSINSGVSGGPTLLLDHTTDLLISGNMFRNSQYNTFWGAYYGQDITLYDNFSGAKNSTNITITGNHFSRTNWLTDKGGLLAPICVDTNFTHNVKFNISGNSYVGYNYEVLDHYASVTGVGTNQIRTYTNMPVLNVLRTNHPSPTTIQVTVTSSGGALPALMIGDRSGYGIWKYWQAGISGSNVDIGTITARLPPRAVWWVTNLATGGSATLTNLVLTP